VIDETELRQSENTEVCKDCFGTGTKLDPVKGALPCPCRRPDRFKKVLAAAHIPRRYEKCTFANFIEKEKARAKALDKVFGEVAKKASECPSKDHGGELGWFPRLGKMVEPFSAAAFTLQPYQLSDPVVTEFGYHLILPVDNKPGRDIKFEQAKPFVREVFAERLREAVLQQMKPAAKIEVKKAP
jgi:hypothetical protein